MAAPGRVQVPYAAHLGAAGALALGLFLYVVGTGLAGTSDTRDYLYAARTLRESGALLMRDGSPYWQWPPLFPVVLRFIGPGAVLGLNGAAVLATLVAWGLAGRQLLPPARQAALPWLLALSSPMLVAGKFLWSEALYSALWAGYVWALLAWLQRGNWRWGVAATVLGCLLPLQRLAGLFLLAGVGAGLLWPGTRLQWRPGWPARAAHLAGAAAGLLLWQVHRWPQSLLGSAADGALVTQPVAALAAIVADYGYVLSRWLLPVLPAARLAGLPALGWVLPGLLLAWWPRRYPTASQTSRGALAGIRLLYLALLATLVLLVFSTWRGRSGPGIHDAERYLLPLYPVVVLLVLRAWPAGRWATQLGPWLLGGWLLGQAGRVGHVAYQLRQLPPADTQVFSSKAQPPAR